MTFYQQYAICSICSHHWETFWLFFLLWESDLFPSGDDRKDVEAKKKKIKKEKGNNSSSSSSQPHAGDNCFSQTLKLCDFRCTLLVVLPDISLISTLIEIFWRIATVSLKVSDIYKKNNLGCSQQLFPRNCAPVIITRSCFEITFNFRPKHWRIFLFRT